MLIDGRTQDFLQQLMLSITTKAILLVLTHTILLDNTITIPTTNIQLTAPLDVGLISISQNSPFTNIELISQKATQTRNSFSLEPNSKNTFPLIDISLVQLGIYQDISNQGSRFQAALELVMELYPWASDLHVVKVEKKGGSADFLRFWLQGKSKKGKNTDDAIFQAQKKEGKERYTITLSQYIHVSEYNRQEIEQMVSQLKVEVPELMNYSLFQASNDSKVHSKDNAGQLMLRLRKGSHQVFVFRYSYKGASRLAIYGL